MNDEHLDIPDFLRRQAGDVRSDDKPAAPAKPRRKKRPPGWFSLTRAEQLGIADATTIALRKQIEREKEQKTVERFRRLRELKGNRRS